MIAKKELLELEYYLQRMSLFMNESHGFEDRMRIFWNILTSIDTFYNKLFEYYDILNVVNPDKDYYTYYLKDADNVSSKTKGAIKDGNGNYFVPIEMLDKVGAIFNCTRNITIKCSALDENGNYINTSPTTEDDLISKKFVTLNNKEFLTYIKMQIRKQYFNGSREELAALYGAENSTNADEINLYYVTQYNLTEQQNVDSATVTIYWSNGASAVFTPTMRYLFLNGLLTIESLGISYQRTIQNIDNLSMFDDAKFATPEEPETPVSYYLWG